MTENSLVNVRETFYDIQKATSRFQVNSAERRVSDSVKNRLSSPQRYNSLIKRLKWRLSSPNNRELRCLQNTTNDMSRNSQERLNSQKQQIETICKSQEQIWCPESLNLQPKQTIPPPVCTVHLKAILSKQNLVRQRLASSNVLVQRRMLFEPHRQQINKEASIPKLPASSPVIQNSNEIQSEFQRTSPDIYKSSGQMVKSHDIVTYKDFSKTHRCSQQYLKEHQEPNKLNTPFSKLFSSSGLTRSQNIQTNIITLSKPDSKTTNNANTSPNTPRKLSRNAICISSQRQFNTLRPRVYYNQTGEKTGNLCSYKGKRESPLCWSENLNDIEKKNIMPIELCEAIQQDSNQTNKICHSQIGSKISKQSLKSQTSTINQRSSHSVSTFTDISSSLNFKKHVFPIANSNITPQDQGVHNSSIKSTQNETQLQTKKHVKKLSYPSTSLICILNDVPLLGRDRSQTKVFQGLKKDTHQGLSPRNAILSQQKGIVKIKLKTQSERTNNSLTILPIVPSKNSAFIFQPQYYSPIKEEIIEQYLSQCTSPKCDSIKKYTSFVDKNPNDPYITKQTINQFLQHESEIQRIPTKPFQYVPLSVQANYLF